MEAHNDARIAEAALNAHDNAQFEQILEKVLSQDLSAGSEAFRDDLLKRCLETLASDEEPYQLSEDELELLSAAGALERDNRCYFQ